MEDTKPVGSEQPPEVAESQTHKNGETNIGLNTPNNGPAEIKNETKNELVDSDLAKEVAEEDQGEMVVEAAEDTIIY
jgi:hypothetical protein